MRDMNTITKYVIRVLEDYPEARDDDDYLYLRVCDMINPFCKSMSVALFFQNRGVTGVPNYNSVCRAGRKAKEKNPELKGSKTAIEKKYKRWKEMREYAIKI